VSRPGLLADENIPAPLVGALRDAGWDVRYVAEHSPGITDREVLALVRDERRVLLTEDPVHACRNTPPYPVPGPGRLQETA